MPWQYEWMQLEKSSWARVKLSWLLRSPSSIGGLACIGNLKAKAMLSQHAKYYYVPKYMTVQASIAFEQSRPQIKAPVRALRVSSSLPGKTEVSAAMIC